LIIRYNSGWNRFEAQFSTDFHGDLAAVKAAGFKTDGPPAWVWYTAKVPVLQKLRENKPPSGLEITEEAYAVYAPMAERYEKNLAVKKEAAVLVKKAKKEQKLDEEQPPVIIPHKPGELFDYIGQADMPYKESVAKPLIIHKLDGPPCISCGDPIAFYEQQNPPLCLWCELHPKNALDTSAVL